MKCLHTVFRAAAVVAVFVSASALDAQTLRGSPLSAVGVAQPISLGSATAEAVPLGPVVTSVGVQRAAASAVAMSGKQSSPARRDVAWMVLGGAALVVGSIVGGDGGTIIMVTGGVIGLVGLWRYLQYS